MWKNYSSDYIKNNKASGISIMMAAFISALFLSLLCSLFYNFWQYDIERIKLEEGDWQGRIVGEIQESDLSAIQNFKNIEKWAINEKLSEKKLLTIDFSFYNMRTILEDMPQIANLLGVESQAIAYHHSLLAMYLIRDPSDPAPRLLFPLFIFITALVCLSLVLIIHNSFAVSMNARVHQFGIFSSIGATPGQVRTCLLQEAGVLCIVPIFLGILTGILISIGVLDVTNRLAMNVAGRHEAQWVYHPVIFILALAATALTVYISAWLPARKLSGLTPLEAIRNSGELQLKRKKHSHILSLLFGVEGELAGNALKAQKRALRTSTLSLTLSFLSFTILLSFFTLADISTRHTYFDRYQNAWDIMVSLKDVKIQDIDFDEFREYLQETKAIQNCTIYQKAETISRIPDEEISPEIEERGGLMAIAGSSVSREAGAWSVKAPVVVLNDEAYQQYCQQIGAAPDLDGTVILNQIWDNVNSNFRYKEFIPYVGETAETIILESIENKQEQVEIPVIAYTQVAPALREEYSNYALVQFVSVSLWQKISKQIGSSEADCYIRLLTDTDSTLEKLNTLEKAFIQRFGSQYEMKIENRIQEKISNDAMIWGYKAVIGGFCVLLAIIGIANVFSNTMGFLRQRKREFAQYMSVGMTEAGMRKLFTIEVLVIGGQPLMITLPITLLFVGSMISASYLNPIEFIVEAPIIPVIIFCMAIFGFVGLAYYMGGKKVLNCNLVSALRDDTIV